MNRCGCEPGFTCSRCAGTPDDDRDTDAPYDPWANYPDGAELPDGHEPDTGYLA